MSLTILRRGPCPYLPPSQLIPGHEAVGVAVEIGKDVTGFQKGDRCVADVGITVSGFDPTN